MKRSRQTHPGFMKLAKAGELAKKVAAAREILASCTLCPRKCRVNRLGGKTGFCGADGKLMIAKALPHLGEEPPLSGTRGAGTIFFSHCNMRCLFCQNSQISHDGMGNEIGSAEFTRMMLGLQEKGCHNIEFVSPSHYLPHILEALDMAARGGLKIPVVWNTNGYESLETLKLLDGVVDVYLPDIKYSDDSAAKEISSTGDYVEHNRAALKEMFRQVGLLECDADGIANRGLIVRHLVLPGNLAQTRECLRFVAEEVSRNVNVALMAQYNPVYEAENHPVLKRKISREEYDSAVKCAEEFGLENCWIQELESPDSCLPDFAKQQPFDFDGGATKSR